MNSKIKIQIGADKRIKVLSSNNPTFVEKIRGLKWRRWHSGGEYWSFLNANGTLEKVLKVFVDKTIHINPIGEFAFRLSGDVWHKRTEKACMQTIFINL